MHEEGSERRKRVFSPFRKGKREEGSKLNPLWLFARTLKEEKRKRFDRQKEEGKEETPRLATQCVMHATIFQQLPMYALRKSISHGFRYRESAKNSNCKIGYEAISHS